MSFGALGLPTYLVEMNVSGTTASWVLGLSALGSGTVLRSAQPIGLALSPVTGFIAAEIGRGRDDELSQVQAGTLSLTMDNADGRFSPDNAASPYYPNIVPRRQIRLSARFSNATYVPLFFGYVQSVRPVDNGPADGNVVIQATDWLGKAAGVDLTDVRPQESDYGRWITLSQSIGVDGLPFRYLGPAGGAETLLAKTYAEKGLGALQEIAATARGLIYHGADGQIVYKTRYGRWTTPGAFAAGGWYFDQPGLNADAHVMPYTDLDYDMTMQFLYNRITVTGGGGSGAQVAADTPSQLRYGLTTLNLSLPLLDGTRSAALAATLLAGYKDPYPRVHSITVDGGIDAGGVTPLWDTLLAVDLWDTARVVKRTPGSVAIDRTMFVEGIKHSIVAKERHTLTLSLSDQQQAGPPPWILGTSRLGIDSSIIY